MKKIRIWSVVAVVALVGFSVGVSAQASYTVGDFAVNLAKMISAKPEIAVEDATEFLGHLGIQLTGPLDAEMNEAVLVEAFNEIGLHLSTSNPDQVVTGQAAEQLFRLFDRADSLFSSEVLKLCKGGARNQNTPCTVDSDCDGGFCQELNSVRCQEGSNDGNVCSSDLDCPDGTCNIPPGQAKKLDFASPSF